MNTPQSATPSAVARLASCAASHLRTALPSRSPSDKACAERRLIHRRKRCPAEIDQRANPATSQYRHVHSLLPGSDIDSAIAANATTLASNPICTIRSSSIPTCASRLIGAGILHLCEVAMDEPDPKNKYEGRVSRKVIPDPGLRLPQLVTRFNY